MVYFPCSLKVYVIGLRTGQCMPLPSRPEGFVYIASVQLCKMRIECTEMPFSCLANLRLVGLLGKCLLTASLQEEVKEIADCCF